MSNFQGLTKTAMVLNLQMSCWLGYRFDRSASEKLTDDASAARDSARVNKHIVPKEFLAPIITARGSVQTHFYLKTLPWKDNGDRLIMRTGFMPFVEEHQALAAKFDAAVEQFLDHDYLVAQDQAQFRMGELFKADDYPTANELKHKFGVNLDIDAIAQAYDFRLSNNEEAMQHRVTQAIGALWRKLADPLERYAEKLAEPDAIFRDSLVGNLRQVVELIPSLNFTEDPDLEAMRVKIESELAGWDAKDLRENKEARSQVADTARSIMEDMRGFMTAMQGSTEGEV